MKCRERGIRVLSAAPAFANAVAELALGLALSCGRDIVGGDRDVRAGAERWLAAADGLDTFLLFGKRVGFVGFGNIGRRLRALIEPFGCELCAHDPWLTDAYLIEEGMEPTTLERLVESCRVIFVLAAPTSENQALLSRELLERIGCRRGAGPRQPRARGRLRCADGARPRRPFPRSDRRLSLRAAPGRSSDPHGPRRSALPAPCRTRPGGALGDRSTRRRRPRGHWCAGFRRAVSRPRSAELAARYVRTTTVVAPAGAAE